MADLTNNAKKCTTPWWQAMVFASIAGGMGWGIRGQYGHETGAMIAGVLVSLTIVLLLCPRASSISLARAVAWGTLAMGIGGTITYGQTVGLTQDAALIGNWDALRWGMLGLGIKGGLWIGFAGAFLGMGLSEVRYRAKEIFLLMLALIAVCFLGIFILNAPFDPANQILPRFYFSDAWFWEPDSMLEPRSEFWGGLLFAWLALFVYAGWIRKDRLARNLAMWGVLGGAIGFPLGQSIQAYHAWNHKMIDETFLAKLQLNWWNMMETTFGATMGAALGLGAWLNRELMNPPPEEEGNHFPMPLGFLLLACHLAMLIAVEFATIRAVDMFYDLGLIMVLVPMVMSLRGRWWPYLQVLPLTMIPIAGKTVRELVYRENSIEVVPGWILYAVVPWSVGLIFAIWSGSSSRRQSHGHSFVRWSLLITTWTYFGLNFAFFRFPWPWEEWTGRTASGLVFTFCTFVLTVLVMMKSKQQSSDEAKAATSQ